MRPNWQYEKSLQQKGYRQIAGLDEAGRGAWAGPIVAAAVILPIGVKISGLNDSKLLTARQRENIFTQIIKLASCWSIGIIRQQIIDSMGINYANRLAMIKAVNALSSPPDYLLIDAIKIPYESESQSIVSGDRKIYSIAAASIIAKVTRDQLMRDYHKKYPAYGFDSHKGYGTRLHSGKIKKHGICALHRLSYKPIKEAIDLQHRIWYNKRKLTEKYGRKNTGRQ